MFSQGLLEPIKLGSPNLLHSHGKENSIPRKGILYFGLMFITARIVTLGSET